MNNHTIKITYCSQCNWMLRSTWMAQEILHTFSSEIKELTLIPRTGGIFTITINDSIVWNRKVDGGFPDVKTLKKLVRDVVNPDKDLGHIESK